MKTIYIDSDYKCHVMEWPNDTPIETDVFDGKCDAYIEGYRFVPEGQAWTRADGQTFAGEMIAPWKDFAQLDAAQRKYEREQLADALAALEVLGYAE